MKKSTIGDVCEINPSKRIPVAPDALISFVPMESVTTNGKLDPSRMIEYGKTKNYSVFQNGDVLFAKITPCMENGKCAIAHDLLNGYGAGSTEFIVLRPDDKTIFSKYLYHFIHQELFRSNCRQNMTGSAGQKRVPIKYLSNYTIPVPPLAEQERIVSKIEELFSQLDAAVAELKNAKEKLNVYRQAVLNDAFRNEEEWEKHPFSNLMESIKNGYGIKPTDNGDYKILKISSVRPLSLNMDEARLNNKPFNSEFLINEFDLLFTRYNGSKDLVGVCAVVPHLSTSYAYPDKIIKCTPKVKNKVHSSFLCYYLNQGKARQYIRSKIKTTSGQNGISGADLKKTLVRIPNINLQETIVNQIEERLSFCTNIEQIVEDSLQRASVLRQSILKLAFEGKL